MDLKDLFEKDVGAAGVDLLKAMLTYDPKRRISAEDALKHEYFTVEPEPTKPGDIPLGV